MAPKYCALCIFKHLQLQVLADSSYVDVPRSQGCWFTRPVRASFFSNGALQIQDMKVKRGSKEMLYICVFNFCFYSKVLKDNVSNLTAYTA